MFDIAYRDVFDMGCLIACWGISVTICKLKQLRTNVMNGKNPEAFDPSCWNFIKLRDIEYPGGVLVYEYHNHPSVKGIPDFLRLNVYLSKDGDFVTIWFGLIDAIFAESRLEPVEKPADFSLKEQYNEELFKGYIESQEVARYILKALRVDASDRYAPHVLSGGADNRLRCDLIEPA